MPATDFTTIYGTGSRNSTQTNSLINKSEYIHQGKAEIGREVSNLQRDMLALPVRYGGLGIANPVKTADREYETSRKVTENLTELIKQQEISLESYSRKSKHLHCKTKRGEGRDIRAKTGHDA